MKVSILVGILWLSLAGNAVGGVDRLADEAPTPGLQQEPQIATFSIVARDPETGDYGVAVQSRYFAVGEVVPHAKAKVGAVVAQGLETQLLRRIRGIRDQLSQEYLLIRIQRTDDQVEHLAHFSLKIKGFFLCSRGHGVVILRNFPAGRAHGATKRDFKSRLW